MSDEALIRFYVVACVVIGLAGLCAWLDRKKSPPSKESDMKKFLAVAAFAALIGSVSFANPADIARVVKAKEACACGDDCPCKDPLNPNGAQTAEPPLASGHYVKVCDGKSCHIVWVPDSGPRAGGNGPASQVVASCPVDGYSLTGRPCEGGRFSQPFMQRGPIRRFLHRGR